MPRWYSPDEPWPVHPDSSMRDALAFARANGWWFHDFAGHSFGRVRCSPPDSEGACTFLVFSSGRGISDAARTLSAKVRRCTHRLPDSERPGIVRAAEALRGAETLIKGAEKSLRLQVERARIDQLLEAAVRRVEYVEALGPLIEAEEAVVADAERIMEVVRGAGYAGGFGASELSDEAESRISEAEARLTSESNTPQRRGLLSTAVGLRARISAIRSSLQRGGQ